MNDAESTIYASIIGALSAVIGGLVVAIFSYFTQRRMLTHQLRLERQKDLHAKRLVALQNILFAIDFIEKTKDIDYSSEGLSIWKHLTMNNGCNLAFISDEHRDGFSYLVNVLYAGPLVEDRQKVDYNRLSELKIEILQMIDRDFDMKNA